jgi:lipopolysaccharide export system permease protein
MGVVVLNKIDMYIVKVIGKPLLSTLFILVGMIWLLQSIKFMDMLVNKNAAFSDFFLVSILTLPDMLLILIPLATFSGAYSGLKKMVLDSEMDAIYSAGISRTEVIKPLMVVALVSVMVSYFISLYAIPVSRTAFYELKEKVKNDTDSLYIEPGTFNKMNSKVTVYVEEIENNQWMKNIIVYDNTHVELPVTWTAKEGVLKIGADNKPSLVLLNGTRQELSEEQTSVLQFKSHQIDLSQRVKDKKVFREKKAAERFVHELLDTEYLKSEKEKRKYKGVFYKRILWPLAPLALCLIPLYFLFAPIKRRFGLNRPSIYAIVTAVSFIAIQMFSNSRIVGGSDAFVYVAIGLEFIVPIIFTSLLIRENFKG